MAREAVTEIGVAAFVSGTSGGSPAAGQKGRPTKAVGTPATASRKACATDYQK